MIQESGLRRRRRGRVQQHGDGAQRHGPPTWPGCLLAEYPQRQRHLHVGRAPCQPSHAYAGDDERRPVQRLVQVCRGDDLEGAAGASQERVGDDSDDRQRIRIDILEHHALHGKPCAALDQARDQQGGAHPAAADHAEDHLIAPAAGRVSPPGLPQSRAQFAQRGKRRGAARRPGGVRPAHVAGQQASPDRLAPQPSPQEPGVEGIARASGLDSAHRGRPDPHWPAFVHADGTVGSQLDDRHRHEAG